jgi:predicted amidohydrolase
MHSFELSLVQNSPLFKNKPENLHTMWNDIQRCDSELIVFPELATTGYFFTSKKELASLSEPAHGMTFRFLKDVSERRKQHYIVGFIEEYKGRFYNSIMLVSYGRKDPIVYRKTHLFYKETLCFSPGNTGFVVHKIPSLDCTVGLMICYDWRFPESARTLGLMGSDLIVCPSNLITNLWGKVMPARAIENKVYFAVANRIGTETANEETIRFTGNSAIYSYEGDELAKAPEAEHAIITTTITPQLTRDKSFNAINDIITDRRPSMYKVK